MIRKATSSHTDQHIGRRPVAAFGHSDMILQMYRGRQQGMVDTPLMALIKSLQDAKQGSGLRPATSHLSTSSDEALGEARVEWLDYH